MLKILATTTFAGVAWLAVVGTASAEPSGDGCCTITSSLVSIDAPTTKPADRYPLEVCPVSGEELGSMGDPIEKETDGRTVKFCCEGCVGAFEKDPEKWHEAMDELIIKAEKGSYPVSECLVSNEGLDEMGGPIDFVHRPTNTLVRFCCKGCANAFKKNPDQFLKELEAARAERDKQAEAEDESAS